MFNLLLEQEDKEDVNTVNNETTVKQTAALTTGSTFGKHMVEPRLSPWKSLRQFFSLRRTRWPSNSRWQQ